MKYLIRFHKYISLILRPLNKLVVSFIFAFLIVIGFLFIRQPVEQKIHGAQSIDYSREYKTNKPKSSSQVQGLTNETVFITISEYNYKAWIFDEFFKANNSPLTGHGEDFVEACIKYGAPSDCTLLPAIAKVETNLCKTDISAEQYNCWGFGGSGENRIIYKSFEESIDSITSRLMQGYGENFFNDPEIGELAYCGSHCSSWGNHVKGVQDDIKELAASKGYTL